MLQTNFFKNEVNSDYQVNGNQMYRKNGEYIADELNSSRSLVIQPINMSAVEKGKFYFIFYDLQGKSSKLEKFNPLFVVDWYDDGKTRQMFGISLNFIPIAIRVVFFNLICNFNLDIIESNSTKQINKQEAFNDISFGKMYKILQGIGFEWAIRKFDVKKINKTYCVSTTIISKFITMSTAKFTGVDDAKLIEIWQKKLGDQKIREKEMIKSILGDYKKMQAELEAQYQTVYQKEDNLEASLAAMQQIK
jgi:hypothetical protein